jgi:16S rRNA (cytosine967-C5)-methyltransferase
MSRDVRAAAAVAIGEVLGGHSLDRSLSRQLAKVSDADRGLLLQLCYGTLRHAPRLQALLAILLDKPLKAKDNDLQGLLMCGLYQFEHTRIPDHAAVAATVGATHALKKDWARGMTNAVLRRFQREREQLTADLTPAAAAGHPQWLYDRINAQWGDAGTDIIAANNRQPPMTLRVNRLRLSRSDYMERLAERGIEARAGSLAPDSLRLAKPMDVHELPGFSAGEVSVQDEAAQLAAILLAAEPGERVLDACAAPGGKCCHILEVQPQLAELVAMDVDETRLERVGENLERLGLQATVMAGDAACPPEGLQAAGFDRILLDAPCSASGVIRRHPDAKLLRRESDIDQLARLQLQLLEGLWPLLKPGGTLLYATCSILEEENSNVVQAFLARHAGATLSIPEAAGGEVVDGGLQVLPATGGPDGLFYARLKKAA